METLDTSELLLFYTTSAGGIRACRELSDVWARTARCGVLPIIALQVAQMRIKDIGNVPRPDFPIVAWDDGGEVALTSPAPKPIATLTRIHEELGDKAVPSSRVTGPLDDDDGIPF